MNSETLNTLDSYSKNKYKYGFVTEIDEEKPKKGLNEDIIKFISLNQNGQILIFLKLIIKISTITQLQKVLRRSPKI